MPVEGSLKIIAPAAVAPGKPLTVKCGLHLIKSPLELTDTELYYIASGVDTGEVYAEGTLDLPSFPKCVYREYKLFDLLMPEEHLRIYCKWDAFLQFPWPPWPIPVKIAEAEAVVYAVEVPAVPPWYERALPWIPAVGGLLLLAWLARR